MKTNDKSTESPNREEESHVDLESIEEQEDDVEFNTADDDVEEAMTASIEVQTEKEDKPEAECANTHESKPTEEPTAGWKDDRDTETDATSDAKKDSQITNNQNTASLKPSSFLKPSPNKSLESEMSPKPNYSTSKRSAANSSALKPTKRASTTEVSFRSSFVPRKEVGFSHDIAFRSPTFIEIIQAMGQSQRFDFFNRIRESFLNLMRPTLTLETNDIPSLDSFLTPNVLAAMDSLQGHFRSFWYRLSVNAPQGGHHPMFDRHGLSRTGVLDPNAFRMASLVVNLNMATTRSFEQLLAEIRQNNNVRVRNWLATHLNEQLSYISMQKQGSSKFYVRQNGLSLHEAALFYFICSRRRLLVDDIQILERAFPYFASDEIFRIVNQMSLYISTNPEIDRALHTFMDGYVRIMYRVFFAPLYADYLDIPVFHEDLNNDNDENE